MNWFDILILVIVIVSFLSGYASGLVMQIASLAGLLLAAIFAGKLAGIFAPKLIAITSTSPHIIAPLSYIIAFILIIVAILFVGRMLTSFIKAIHMNTLNKLAGATFCCLTSIILVSILLNLLVQFDQNSVIIKEDVREHAHTYPLIMETAQMIIPYLRFEWII